MWHHQSKNKQIKTNELSRWMAFVLSGIQICVFIAFQPLNRRMKMCWLSVFLFSLSDSVLFDMLKYRHMSKAPYSDLSYTSTSTTELRQEAIYSIYSFIHVIIHFLWWKINHPLTYHTPKWKHAVALEIKTRLVFSLSLSSAHMRDRRAHWIGSYSERKIGYISNDVIKRFKMP